MHFSRRVNWRHECATARLAAPGSHDAAKEVFIDTSGFFALLSAADPAHGRAREVMAGLARGRRRTVTTEHVLDETYTLLKARGLVHRCPVLKTTVDTSKSLRVAWTEAGQQVSEPPPGTFLPLGAGGQALQVRQHDRHRLAQPDVHQNVV